MKEKVLEELIEEILKKGKEIIGDVFERVVREIPYIKIEEGKIRILGRREEVFDELIAKFEKLMGSAIKGILVRAVIEFLKEHPAKYKEIKDIIPDWIKKTPDMKVLEMRGLLKE